VFVTDLELTDFRSYPGVSVHMDAGVSVFVGANGQGKTNLVEAVEYASTLSSHRVASDAPLVRAGADQATSGPSCSNSRSTPAGPTADG